MAAFEIPAAFVDHLLWRDVSQGGAYVVLLLRAAEEPRLEQGRGWRVHLERGEILWSLRNAQTMFGWTRYQVIEFMRIAQQLGLVHLPEGQPSNRPYRLKLTPPWSDSAHPIAPPTISPPIPDIIGQQPSDSGKTVGPEARAPDFFEDIGQQSEKPKRKPRKEPAPAANGAAPEPDPVPVHRLTQLLHKLGLNEAPHFTGAAWAKQAAKIKQLLAHNSEDAVEAAIRGCRYVWPFDGEDKRPYDAFAVEKHFSEAVAMWHRRATEIKADQHRAAQAVDARRAHADRMEAHQVEVGKWRERLRAQLLELPADQIDRLHKRAKDRAAMVPGMRNPPRSLIEQFAYVIFGEGIGDNPPPPPR
ncbi:MAG: hypothetical protein ACRENP_27680 [Longimicrobiales bacterium]